MLRLAPEIEKLALSVSPSRRRGVVKVSPRLGRSCSALQRSCLKPQTLQEMRDAGEIEDWRFVDVVDRDRE